MIRQPFFFSATGATVCSDAPPGTRFYVGDPVNSTSQLIIARGRYSDILYRAIDRHHKRFERVYTTQLCERILSASAAPQHPSYLITLRTFGDAMDPRASTRSIFLDFSRDSPVEYPISGKTYDFQIAVWSSEQEFPLFTFSRYDGSLSVYEIAHDRNPPSFRMILKRTYPGQIARTGQLRDHSKSDFGPLPSSADMSASSEIRSFTTFRRSNSSQPGDQRVIVHASPCALSVVVPSQCLVLTEPIDYIDIPIPSELIPISAGVSLDVPSEARYRPISRLPFAFYCHDFMLVAAPMGFVTAFLLDHAGRLRAAFRTEASDPEIHRMSALNRVGSKALARDSGAVFEVRMNPNYFIAKNPRWIIPVLHDAIRHFPFHLGSLISKEVLQVYWNGEVFNEALLLELSLQHRQAGLVDRVCSTFAKPRFFTEGIKSFARFEEVPPNRPVEPIFNFRDLEAKGGKLFESIVDVQSLFGKVLKLLDAPMFDVRAYASDLRFHAWLQMTAIRSSLGPASFRLRIDPSIFPPDLPSRVTQTWAARNMLPIDHNWPEIERLGLPFDVPAHRLGAQARRLWWYLRTEPVSMVEVSGGKPHARMFEYVERLTNKTSGNQSGPSLFSLFQYLLGLNLSEPITEV